MDEMCKNTIEELEEWIENNFEVIVQLSGHEILSTNDAFCHCQFFLFSLDGFCKIIFFSRFYDIAKTNKISYDSTINIISENWTIEWKID